MNFSPNLENIRKTVEALRSDKYKQTWNTLCQVDSSGKECFCFWGVVCELAGLPKKKEVAPDGFTDVTFGGYFGNPPEAAQKWLGISRYQVVGGYTLLDMNDELGYTFDDIATVLENTFLR